MKKWLIRLGYGLLFAIPLMLISYALASAAEGAPQPQKASLECISCHPAVVQTWQMGHHSQATKDPAFKSAWEAQGKPEECLKCHVTGYDEVTGTWKSDEITCQACHPTVGENHPNEPVQENRSPELCGECHTDTYFEWKVSTHGQKGLSCTNCHDPHATSLKMEDSSSLCSACHKGLSASYTHSQHSEQGLVCADCHMEMVEKSNHQARQDHTFYVSLETCNRCHSNQLHNPELFQPKANQVNKVDAMAAVEGIQVSGVPKPVNPAGFAILAGLVGIALGINLAPWLERLNHRKGKGG